MGKTKPFKTLNQLNLLLRKKIHSLFRSVQRLAAPAAQNSAQTCIITPFTTNCKCFYESGTVLYNQKKKNQIPLNMWVLFFYSGVVLVLYFEFEFIERIAP